jgi:hypothetical protein
MPNRSFARSLAAFIDRFKQLAARQCLSADVSCVGQIVRAHTVQNALVLDGLAEDGHVYMFQPTPTGTPLTRIGRNQATTFTGYCAHHDHALFRTIDFRSSDDFQPTDKSQAARFALRAAAREYWVKLNTTQLIREISTLARARRVDDLKRLHKMTVEEAEDITAQLRSTLAPFLQGSKHSLEEMNDSYQSLLALTRQGRFHLWRFHAWSLPCAPCVAASSTFYPEYDARGTLIATRLLHEDTPIVVLNVIPLGNVTWILLAHHRRFESRLAGLISDLGSCGRKELAVLVSKMLLVHCENTVFSPRYVATLTPEERARIEEVFDATSYDALPYDRVQEVDLFAIK